MAIQAAADALDTRTVWRWYALVLFLGGGLLAAFGPMWVGSDLPTVPYTAASLVRMVGAVLCGVACLAIAIAATDDELSRQRALFWMAIAFAIVFVMAAIQSTSIWGPGIGDYVLTACFAGTVLFAYLYTTVKGESRDARPILTSLFGSTEASTATLRSQYEQQIREAAGREERQRLARELHDSIKQSIFVIQTSAATAQTRWEEDPAGAREAVDRVRQSAREAMTEMETMLQQLQAAPLESVGLVEALRQQCEALEHRTGCKVDFQPGSLPANDVLPPGVAHAVFRCAQEALSNIARHARARKVTVVLQVLASTWELRISDNGQGFDPDRTNSGMGLQNIRSRASEYGGNAEWATLPGIGTTVTVKFPLIRHVESSFYGWRAGFWLLIALQQIWFNYRSESPIHWAVVFIAVLGTMRETIAFYRSRRREGVA